MALKIRLRQQGKRNRLTYRLVVVDSKMPRDGKYVEMVGHYDPHVDNNQDIRVFEDRIQFWLDRGAELTEKAHALVKRSAPEVIKRQHEQQRQKKAKSAKKKGRQAS